MQIRCFNKLALAVENNLFQLNYIKIQLFLELFWTSLRFLF
jgi:hypothetical protein